VSAPPYYVVVDDEVTEEIQPLASAVHRLSEVVVRCAGQLFGAETAAADETR